LTARWTCAQQRGQAAAGELHEASLATARACAQPSQRRRVVVLTGWTVPAPVERLVHRGGVILRRELRCLAHELFLVGDAQLAFAILRRYAEVDADHVLELILRNHNGLLCTQDATHTARCAELAHKFDGAAPV
jgi:hypothetical protein